jgi:hypothetical protein
MSNTRKKVHNAIIEGQKWIFGATDISINKLRTKNRRDIEYRIAFLNQIVDGSDYRETLYYHFISDPKRWTQEPGQERCETFVNLVEDIRENGIQTPITVRKYYLPTLNAKTGLAGNNNYVRIKNRTGYQLVDGAHRVAAAVYLNWNTIPAYVLRLVSFEVPEYSDYIQRRKPYYYKLIGEENNSTPRST